VAQALELLANSTEGGVRIGVTPPLSLASLFRAVIERLSQQYPRIYFEIRHSNVEALLHELRDRRGESRERPSGGDVVSEDMDEETLFHDRHVPLGDARSSWAGRRKPPGPSQRCTMGGSAA
jgi:DNA-binding transcriptional LysR family regulator